MSANLLLPPANDKYFDIKNGFILIKELMCDWWIDMIEAVANEDFQIISPNAI